MTAIAPDPQKGRAGDWFSRAARRIAGRLAAVVSVLIATTSGILSFLTTGGLGAQALRLVAIFAVVAFLILVANEVLVRDRTAMKQALLGAQSERDTAQSERDTAQSERNRAQSERDSYRGILQRIIDRQSLNYQEKLHIHALVGDTDEEDRIIETHTTTPTPKLYYRSLKPIVTSGTRPKLADLHLEVKIKNANGVRASITTLSEDPLRILIMFDPAIGHVIEWSLEYRAPGLFEPLRRSGVDELSWDARTPSGRQDEYTFNEFQVTFKFPKSILEAQAHARVTGGEYIESTAQDGALERSWIYRTRVNERMTWDLTMEPTPHSPKI